MPTKIQGRNKEAMTKTKKYEYQCWIDIDWEVEENKPHFATQDEETMRAHLLNHKNTELAHELLDYIQEEIKQP